MMPSKPPLLTLTGAQAIRNRYARIHGTRGALTDRVTSIVTGITEERLLELESRNKHVACEPWLDEAYALSRVIGAHSIWEMLGVDTFAELELEFDIQDDLDVWRTGVRLPLRFGLRLAHRFDLNDPFDLIRIEGSIHQRMWRMLEAGERTSAPPTCPWCHEPATVGGPGHLRTCTPGQLYGPRDRPVEIIGQAPTPRRAGKRKLGSRMAGGLKHLRESRGVTQEVFAKAIGKAPNYYARLERMDEKLNQELAEHIAAVLKVSVADVYLAPEPPKREESAPPPGAVA